MAEFLVNGSRVEIEGKFITGGPWDRFGLYNSYVIVRADGQILKIPSHSGELVPGSTEDLIETLDRFEDDTCYLPSPMTLEIDPTYSCTSQDCGGCCFSKPYRSLAPRAEIPTALLRNAIRAFAEAGGRILRFDGGGDPLAHAGVKSGDLVEYGSSLGLKTTVLTAGDLLERTDLHRFGHSKCYLRVSLNAATDSTRRRFHGNKASLNGIFKTLESFAGWIERERLDLPVGATFLLVPMNYREVVVCARHAAAAGIRHFSVRRVLGPPSMRPAFSRAELDEVQDLLKEVELLHSDHFRVAVPWRPLEEPDLDPSAGDFTASRCWQSIFKTIIEPDPGTGGVRAQLCGRYRGGGIGQKMHRRPLFSTNATNEWIEKWQESFNTQQALRHRLIQECVSCIDRGFILLMERLLTFLRGHTKQVNIYHLHSPNPQEVIRWSSENIRLQ